MAIGQSITGGLAFKGSKDALNAQKEAANQLTARMDVEKQNYLARRPQAQQERAQALRQQLSLLGPSNSLVNEMSGGKYSLNLGPEVANSPVSMKPLQSQLGPMYNGGYSQSTVNGLRAQGYDISGIPKAMPQPSSVPPKAVADPKRKNGAK